MAYVDGFLVPLPKDKVEQYRALASTMADMWREFGALSVVEAIADDAPYGDLTSFPRAVQQSAGETVVFSYITYRDRAHRDEVNARFMADPRMRALDMAFIDGKRMVWGGFEVLVQR